MATAIVAESRYDPRSVTVEALDARLTALVRSGAPLRRALARIAGAFVAHRAESPKATVPGWEPLGFVRPADYARERPGLSARELQQLARVDAKLARLPGIDRALSTGQLGWTKARLLCRVATPEDEERWLEDAKRVPAAALAREVRACDVEALESGGLDAPQEGEPERAVLRVRVPPRVKTKWGAVRRTLRQAAGAWLPNEACVELALAEVLSAIELEADPEAPPPLAHRVRTGEAEPELPAPPSSTAPAEPSAFVLKLLAGLEAAGPRELDARLCRAAALERGRTNCNQSVLWTIALKQAISSALVCIPSAVPSQPSPAVMVRI
jgi:hypothetical protein